MNTTVRQWIFGTIFFGFGIYRFTNGDTYSFLFYATTGLAFIANGLSVHPSASRFKMSLIIATWVLISIAAIFFVLILRRMF